MWVHLSPLNSATDCFMMSDNACLRQSLLATGNGGIFESSPVNQIIHRDNPMKCSRSEFFTAIQGWRDCSCAVHLHTNEISGAFVVTFCWASEQGVLEFSAHPLLQPLTVDLSNA